MQDFQFQITFQDGKLRSGALSAPDLDSARARLVSLGAEILSLERAREGLVGSQVEQRESADPPGPAPGPSGSDRPRVSSRPALRPRPEPQGFAGFLPAPTESPGTAGPSRGFGPPIRAAREWLAGQLRSVSRALVIRRIPRARVGETFDRLSVMLQAGITLLPALYALLRQELRPDLARVLAEVIAHVSTGGNLSSALAAHREVFPSFVVAMVRSGEQTGTVQPACRDIALVVERETALQQRLHHAIQYPLLVMLSALAMSFALFRWVLPGTLNSVAGAELSWSGRLVALGVYVANQPALLALGALLVAVLAWQARLYVASSEGRLKVERFLMGLPVAGRLLSQVAQVRAARCLAAQLRAGVLLLSALELAQEVCGNASWAQNLERACRAMKEGETLAATLNALQAPHSHLLVSMIRAGEESGNLAPMLERAADMLESDADLLLENLVQLVEPFMISAAGLGTLFVLVGVISTMQRSLHGL